MKLQKKVKNTEDDYVSASDVTAGKKVTANQIQKQTTLVTGRFAVVHSGLLIEGNEIKPIAIKSLKRTYDRTEWTKSLRSGAISNY